MFAKFTVLAAAIGAIVAGRYGAGMGQAVQAALTATFGLVAAVAVHADHANRRALLSASVQVGAHEAIGQAVAGAVHHALGEAFSGMLAGVVPGAPDASTVRTPTP